MARVPDRDTRGRKASAKAWGLERTKKEASVARGLLPLFMGSSEVRAHSFLRWGRGR